VLLVRLVGGSPPLAFPRWFVLHPDLHGYHRHGATLIWFLNRRFSRRHPATGGIILRQSMWFGLFGVTATWMQMTRALSGAIAFFLALSMIVIETFLRLRERSQDGS